MRPFFWAAIFLSLTLRAQGPSSPIRCAFDVGSGETKVAAGPVVAEGQPSILYRQRIQVPIKKTVKDGVLPVETRELLSNTLKVLKQGCLKVGATEFTGVATSGFRAAKTNGAESLAQVARETGIDLRIVTGDEEAALGYKAVKNTLKDAARAPLVVWDVGGGSMQFASEKAVVSLPVGATSFYEELLKVEKRAAGASLLPLSKAEVAKATGLAAAYARQVPEELQRALQAPGARIVGVGGPQSDSIGKGAGDASGTYTLKGVQGMRGELTGKDVAWIQKRFPENHYPENQLPNSILISSLMEALKIDRVETLEINLTDGLLVR